MIHKRQIYSCYCILFLSILVTCDAFVRIRKYVLYKVIAFSNKDRQILYLTHNNFEHGNFLNGITNEAAIPMHVAVDINYQMLFDAYLNSSDCIYIKYAQIEHVPRQHLAHHAGELINDSIVHLKFNDFRTIQKVYQYWENKYPKNFKKIVIGTTGDNNELVVLKVYHQSSEANNNKKPAVFVLGGEEGRDWISPAVILAYMKFLLEGEFDDPDDQLYWTQRFDMYFLPVSNPDGYAFSLYKLRLITKSGKTAGNAVVIDNRIVDYFVLSTTNDISFVLEKYRGIVIIVCVTYYFKDRFWAKNKKIITPHKQCGKEKSAIGVNIDRNWLFNHRDDEACSKTYLGHYLSENETSRLADFLDSLAPRTLGFFNVRGFDNLITTPFADKGQHQNNINTIMEILSQVSHDVSISYNKSYYYGTTASLLFNHTGNCADWVKQNLNVPVVATLYLKHGDNVLPEVSDIIPLGRELGGGMNLILSLTIDLYEPLFKSQPKLTIFNVILLLICVCYIF